MMQNAKASDFLHFEDDLAEAFFSEPPPRSESLAPVEVEAWQGRDMASRERWAMVMTVSAVGVALLVCVGLALRPSRGVEVGQAHLAPLSLPTALSLAPAEPEPEPESEAVPVPVPAAVEAAVVEAAVVEAPEAPAVAGTAPARHADSPRSRADQLIKRAFRAHNGGQQAVAARLAEQAIALDATRAGAYIVLGGVLDTRGDDAGAQRAFRRCVANATDALVDGCRTLIR